MPPDRDQTERDNPYERYQIDPLGGPAAITERMRELVEDAPDDETRAAIRAAWEELTLHPARRFRAAIHAHPEHRSAIGRRPPPPRPIATEKHELTIADVVMRPSILSALGAAEATLPDVAPDHDPILRT